MMNTMRLIPLFLLLLLSSLAYGQERIEWYTFQEAIQRSQIEKKKIMVDVYTKWCGWCKVMDQKTFRDPEVIKYINNNYIAVRLDAEEDITIPFKGKNYSLVKEGGKSYHELASEIMRGRLSFPTIVFMDEQINVIQPIPGFQDHEQFLMVLRYFGENNHQRIPWDKYTQQYKANNSISQPVNSRGGKRSMPVFMLNVSE
jgi:thioredoxin-related protein